jgi:alanine racemase
MTLDLDALVHNFHRIQTFAPQRSILAMIKANAYGHGIVAMAQALEQAQAFGVACFEEGLKLREAGIKNPIVLMEGLFHPDEVKEAAHYDFTLVVHQREHVDILEHANATLKHKFFIWLKVNTGMNRLGVDARDLTDIHTRLCKLECVQQPIGLMTHFAQADVVGSVETLNQIKFFKQATEKLPGLRSLANSAAIIAWPEALGDWVRPGLMLYGASPFADKLGLDHELKPVMTLASRLIAVNKVQKGGKIGYGGTWSAPEDMLVGVVGVGYGDGYPQFAQNGTPVLVNKKECALVGRVSMDMLTVDLRTQPQAKIGDPVVLWGQGLPVERVARHSHTSAYEILTRMTPRPKIEIKPIVKKEVVETENYV